MYTITLQSKTDILGWVLPFIVPPYQILAWTRGAAPSLALARVWERAWEPARY